MLPPVSQIREENEEKSNSQFFTLNTFYDNFDFLFQVCMHSSITAIAVTFRKKKP